MTFQNFKSFIAVVEEGSITRAAEKLNISQQGLSNLIKAMEKELGCELFLRTKPLELTYAGRYFLQSSERIIDIQKQTKAFIDDIIKNSRGELRIGISHTRGQVILPQVLPIFYGKYPNVELKLSEGSTEHLESQLDKGLIDLMIGYAPFMIECAETTLLTKEHLCLFADKNLLTKYFGDKTEEICSNYKKTSDISLFKDVPFVLLKKGERIRTIFDNEISKTGVKPYVKIETQNIQTALALSAASLGITVCPNTYLKSQFVIHGNTMSKAQKQLFIANFIGQNHKSDIIAIGYNKNRYLSVIAKDFIDVCKNYFEE